MDCYIYEDPKYVSGGLSGLYVEAKLHLLGR